MQAEYKVLRGLFWCIVGCLSLAIFFEFRFDTFIKYPVFLSGHRGFAINVLLGGFASAVVSFVMTLLSYLNKKRDFRTEMYPYIKQAKDDFEKYYAAIQNQDYVGLINGMEAFEDCMTNLLECYYSQGVTLFEYSGIEKYYCCKIIGYSTHIMNFNICVKEKSEAKINHLFYNIGNWISAQVYEDFIHIIDKWLKEYEKCYVNPPSDEEVYKHIKEVIDEYNKLE